MHTTDITETSSWTDTHRRTDARHQNNATLYIHKSEITVTQTNHMYTLYWNTVHARNCLNLTTWRKTQWFWSRSNAWCWRLNQCS